MEEDLAKAVRHAFVSLYREGLIYRKESMLNWDPESQTVLSDLEIEYEENYEGELYHFAYPLLKESSHSGQKAEIVVATTRPETILGDTAIAVHPEDSRYKALIGHYAQHPLLSDRKIRILADEILVDPQFGTGAVKLTPAHDPNDFEAGKRHNLESIHIFDERACINAKGGAFAGMGRYEARRAVKEELKRLGLDRGSKPHLMSLARSQRSGAVIEPIVSTQWFVKTKPLAQKAKEAVESGSIQFIPKQWENTYFHWLDNIQDWCISRQLWWGHRIPAWYGPDHSVFVAESQEEAKKLAYQHYKQDLLLSRDPDVLDTWFSSALWPFSTMGWPKKTKDLAVYYPTTVLVTAFDIIFFWVARMIMMGLHFMKREPFKKVFIHSLMRDAQGKKMSKTKGNVVDPLKAIRQYGADAFRFFLMATLSENKDTSYSEQRLKGYQNFTNKIWNSARFVLMNLQEDFEPQSRKILEYDLEAEDYWILACLNQAIKELTQAIEDYKFHLAAEAIYAFFWHEFCDWYIEFAKARLFGRKTAQSAEAARQCLYYVLENSLGLLHPFMPFISEELYSFLKVYKKNDKIKQSAFSKESAGSQQRHEQKAPCLLASLPWPKCLVLPKETQKEVSALRMLQEALSAGRLIRAQAKIPPSKKINITLRSSNKDFGRAFKEKEEAILRFSGAYKIQLKESYEAGSADLMEAFGAGEVYVRLDELNKLDTEQEKQRIEKELRELGKQRDRAEAKLNNQEFLHKAPKAVIEKEKLRLREVQAREGALESALQRLLVKQSKEN